MDSPGLVNGFYNVWIEGSLATNYPDLTNLFGLDQYDDGSAKYMGVSLRNNSNRPVPIQTVRSKIAELSGPDVPTPIGGAATFTWETQGYGEQFCYVDGQKVANTADMVSHGCCTVRVCLGGLGVGNSLFVRNSEHINSSGSGSSSSSSGDCPCAARRQLVIALN
jgi:hypothetical protein